MREETLLLWLFDRLKRSFRHERELSIGQKVCNKTAGHISRVHANYA